jgi:hypothetical protein
MAFVSQPNASPANEGPSDRRHTGSRKHDQEPSKRMAGGVDYSPALNELSGQLHAPVAVPTGWEAMWELSTAPAGNPTTIPRLSSPFAQSRYKAIQILGSTISGEA